MLDCYPETRDGLTCKPSNKKGSMSNAKVIGLSYLVALMFVPFWFFRFQPVTQILKSGILLGLACVVGELIFFEFYFTQIQFVSLEDAKRIRDAILQT